MKNAIIKTVDVLIYVVVFAFALLASQAWGILGGVAALVGGFVMAASWLVLSGIYQNTKRMADALAKAAGEL